MQLLKGLNLGLAFLVELAMLTAFVWGGFSLKVPMASKILIGVALPIAIVVVWGIYMAPNSSTRLHAPWLQLVENALFFSSAFVLYLSGHKKIAVEFALITFINQILAIIWRQ